MKVHATQGGGTPHRGSRILSYLVVIVRQNKKKTIRFQVGKVAYRFIWACIFALHILNGIYLIGLSWLYYWLLSDSDVWYNLAEGQSDTEHARKVWVFPLIAVLHVYSLVSMCWSSLKERHLVIRNPPQQTWCGSSVTNVPRQRGLFKWFYVISSLWHTWMGPSGIYFEKIFIVRECLEILLQTFQANRLAIFVSTHWMNDIAVICICFNCILTPLLHWIYQKPRDVPKRRALCLLGDFCLDFCCAVLIPFSVIFPYIGKYDPQKKSFPDHLVYDDVWFINAAQEKQLLFITSFFDFLSKALPHFSLWLTLLSAKRLIVQNDEAEDPTGAVSSEIPCSHTSRWTKCLHSVFLVWALVIGTAHIQARAKTPVQGCRLDSSAWFVPKYACTIMQINCFELGINGTAEQVTRFLEPLHPETLQSLLFTHCKDLEIPRVVESFPYLTGLDFYNVSMSNWKEEEHARLTQEFHPWIAYIYFVRVEFYDSKLPAGFYLHDQMPWGLCEIGCVHTNLKSLPDTLALYGTNISFLSYDYSNFETFPQILTQMPNLVVLSMTGTSLERIPSDFLTNKTMWQLVFVYNPNLQNIPEEPLGDTVDLWRVIFAHTNISTIPDWLVEWYDTIDPYDEHIQISALGTPYCEKKVSLPECLNDTSLCAALCKEPNFDLYWYPIELIDAQRPPISEKNK